MRLNSRRKGEMRTGQKGRWHVCLFPHPTAFITLYFALCTLHFPIPRGFTTLKQLFFAVMCSKVGWQVIVPFVPFGLRHPGDRRDEVRILFARNSILVLLRVLAAPASGLFCASRCCCCPLRCSLSHDSDRVAQHFVSSSQSNGLPTLPPPFGAAPRRNRISPRPIVEEQSKVHSFDGCAQPLCSRAQATDTFLPLNQILP